MNYEVIGLIASIFVLLSFIPKEIKWFFQRGFRGYSDRDVWNIDEWFLNIIKF